MIKNLFFDLDGTLTDSSEGITKCAKLALEHFGITGYELSELTAFIGPPLRDSFPNHGIAESDVEEAIKVFRGRYNTIGKFENVPYDGIKSVLERLKNSGHRLYVATSKPEVTAVQILDKFDLSQYFEIICGATMDGGRDSKESVIKYLLENISKDNNSILKDDDFLNDVVMIGDTKFDVIGASVFGIKTIGVTWGFGTAEEMIEAGAIKIVDNVDQLYDAVK